MEEAIKAFDEYLESKGLKFEGIVIGGAALILLHVIDRATKDVDILAPKIPEDIKKASIDFATEKGDLNLNPGEWFNHGPYPLKRDLPDGWRDRTVEAYAGKALFLYTLGRMDLLKIKIYATCDREIDFDDCLSLKPTIKELDDCKPWVLTGDINPNWPERVNEVLGRLKKEVENG
ncbi:MAG: hypothetical protein DRQ88_10970 [Epsilonproteobacteria bacterium]|nr:MAG: hypothetical protein DRQ89_11145 [Campylobacterota bacterium]RLA64423.1 MAG: hypothetical protein DRQ88_10970 [Campylobacterota bacterium]